MKSATENCYRKAVLNVKQKEAKNNGGACIKVLLKIQQRDKIWVFESVEVFAPVLLPSLTLML